MLVRKQNRSLKMREHFRKLLVVNEMKHNCLAILAKQDKHKKTMIKTWLKLGVKINSF
jgi:hypothetical protein